MMALRSIDNPNVEDLPNARWRTEVGDRVLVRTRRSSTKTGGDWHPAKVVMVARRGVQAKTTDYGKLDFYHWSDVRLDPSPDPRKVKETEADLGPPPETRLLPDHPYVPPDPAPQTVTIDPAELIKDNATLATMMRRWRAATGLTQAAASATLAAASHAPLSTSHYSHFELGRRSPNLDILVGFAELTNIDLEVLGRASEEQRKLNLKHQPDEESEEPAPDLEEELREADLDAYADRRRSSELEKLLGAIQALTEQSEFTTPALAVAADHSPELRALLVEQVGQNLLPLHIGKRFSQIAGVRFGRWVIERVNRYAREGAVWRIIDAEVDEPVTEEQAPDEDDGDYLWLSPRAAWERIGCSSLDTLWHLLRRDERDGFVDLGKGISAHRSGERGHWKIRIPKAPALPDEPATASERTKPDNFLVWSEKLQELTPVPQDRDLRRRWFVLVRELYEIWKKEQ